MGIYPGGEIELIGNNKRTESEIIFDILHATRNDIKKTHLMYKTNLTFNQLNKYLDVLKEKGLIQETDPSRARKTYFRTSKGNHLLESLTIVLEYFK